MNLTRRDDGEYLIEADLPEVKKEDVRVELQDGMLCLHGERKQEKDPQKATAKFKDGVLKVHLPKSPSVKTKSIEVRVS